MFNIISKIHFLNTWIVVIPAWLSGILVARSNSDNFKQATDMSWYGTSEKVSSFGCFFSMITFMVISIFIPFNTKTIYFFAGILVIVFGYFVHLKSKKDYMKSSVDHAASNGIYKYSRNPMYLSFSLLLLGTSAASNSILLFAVWLPYAIFTHILIIGEERQCKKVYGKPYEEYMKKVPRYILWF